MGRTSMGDDDEHDGGHNDAWDDDGMVFIYWLFFGRIRSNTPSFFLFCRPCLLRTGL